MQTNNEKHTSDAIVVWLCILGFIITVLLSGCGTVLSRVHGDCGRIYDEEYAPESKVDEGVDLLMCTFDIKGDHHA